MSDSGTPLPRPHDPDFVLENAAFHALSYPPNRLVLGLLAVENLSTHELSQRVRDAAKCVEELKTVGLLTTGLGRGKLLQVGGPGLDSVRKWLSLLP